MEAQEASTEAAKWAFRNPNGLQPVVAFADDYASPGRLHYNVPPPHVLSKSLSIPAPTAPSSTRWCGYRGSKPFFAQQPTPGRADIQMTGAYMPHRSSIDRVSTKQTDLPQGMRKGVLRGCVNVTAEVDPES